MNAHKNGLFQSIGYSHPITECDKVVARTSLDDMKPILPKNACETSGCVEGQIFFINASHRLRSAIQAPMPRIDNHRIKPTCSSRTRNEARRATRKEDSRQRKKWQDTIKVLKIEMFRQHHASNPAITEFCE